GCSDRWPSISRLRRPTTPEPSPTILRQPTRAARHLSPPCSSRSAGPQPIRPRREPSAGSDPKLYSAALRLAEPRLSPTTVARPRLQPIRHPSVLRARQLRRLPLQSKWPGHHRQLPTCPCE